MKLRISGPRHMRVWRNDTFSLYNNVKISLDIGMMRGENAYMDRLRRWCIKEVRSRASVRLRRLFPIFNVVYVDHVTNC